MTSQFHDSARPWHLAGSSHTIVNVMFPRSLMPLRPKEVARLTGAHIHGGRGVGALVSLLALQLPRHLDEDAAAAGARLGTALVVLLDRFVSWRNAADSSRSSSCNALSANTATARAAPR